MHRLAAAVATICVPATTAEAQIARGAVRDSDTGAPVAGVVVLALDSAATVRARSVASGVGEYRVSIQHAVKLRFVRIGYRPEERVIVIDPQADTRLLPLPLSNTETTADRASGGAATNPGPHQGAGSGSAATRPPTSPRSRSCLGGRRRRA